MRAVALFAEAEGFAHVHFHVVPRQPDLDRGCAAREYSACSVAIRPAMCPAQVMDEVAVSVGQALRLES